MKVQLSKEEKKLRRQKKIQAIKQRLSNLKTKDKKEKAEKAYRPPGYIARKAGAGVFWIIFIGMFLFLFVLVTVNTSSKARQGQDVVEQTENPSVKPEALQFAENFTCKGDRYRQRNNPPEPLTQGWIIFFGYTTVPRQTNLQKPRSTLMLQLLSYSTTPFLLGVCRPPLRNPLYCPFIILLALLLRLYRRKSNAD
ncbi:hypothetical protein [Bacillus licheniformis]|uniref:hypothetical protein n=1 Tax=Bacillus licheniformis TaxID=1402 RepID=UPI00228299E0|nr:hypothetical protein [Bacillus licheniformis]MCY8021504.1 hypothetical protein [Bacillus licheniformis]